VLSNRERIGYECRVPRSRRRAVIAALALLSCGLASPAAPAHAADASWTRPLVAIAYYSSADLPAIEDSVRAAHLRSSVPVYYGNYWGTSPSRRERVHAAATDVSIPNGRWAPIFGWTPNKFWDHRRLSSEEEGRLSSTDRRMDGPSPSLSTLLAKGGSTAYGWGRELGRRFRDRAREVESHGDKVERWQFDEVPTNAVKSDGRKARDLVRGMLDGLLTGRPELGDRHVRGIVYMANATLELASKPNRGELRDFWRTINRDSVALVGEEYPRFEGNPRRSAFVQSAGQREMARQGKVLGKLASKYVVGVTPGYRDVPGLGGNVKHKSKEGVDAWRADFLNARAQYGVAGFATYNLLGDNGKRTALRPLFAAFRDGLRALGAAR
jgi:hypothetical protein